MYCYDRAVTQVDVTFRLLAPPRESSALALNSLREVYGIRRLHLDERARTISIEYDGTRLTEQGIRQLLRRAGLDLASDLVNETVPDEAPSAA